jgi:hypothetical protein
VTSCPVELGDFELDGRILRRPTALNGESKNAFQVPDLKVPSRRRHAPEDPSEVIGREFRYQASPELGKPLFGVSEVAPVIVAARCLARDEFLNQG